MNQLAQQIDKQISNIAGNASIRQSIIDQASGYAASLVGLEISQHSAVIDQKWVDSLAATFVPAISATVDTMIAKNINLGNPSSTAIAIGKGYGEFQIDEMMPKLMQAVRARNERISANDRKHMPSPTAELAMREQGAGVSNVAAANLPLLDAKSALLEIENRSNAGRQYPAKKKQK